MLVPTPPPPVVEWRGRLSQCGGRKAECMSQDEDELKPQLAIFSPVRVLYTKYRNMLQLLYIVQ